jgi:hypothetical protein
MVVSLACNAYLPRRRHLPLWIKLGSVVGAGRVLIADGFDGDSGRDARNIPGISTQYARARARWAGGRNLCSLCCEQRRDRWPSVHRQARDSQSVSGHHAPSCAARLGGLLCPNLEENSRVWTRLHASRLRPETLPCPVGSDAISDVSAVDENGTPAEQTARAYSTPRQREPGIFGARSLVECPRRSEHRLLRIRLQLLVALSAVPNDAWSGPQPRADRPCPKPLDTVGRFIVEHAIEKFIDLWRRGAGRPILRVLALSCMSRTGTLVDPLACVCVAQKHVGSAGSIGTLLTRILQGYPDGIAGQRAKLCVSWPALRVDGLD